MRPPALGSMDFPPFVSAPVDFAVGAGDGVAVSANLHARLGTPGAGDMSFVRPAVVDVHVREIQLIDVGAGVLTTPAGVPAGVRTGAAPTFVPAHGPPPHPAAADSKTERPASVSPAKACAPAVRPSPAPPVVVNPGPVPPAGAKNHHS